MKFSVPESKFFTLSIGRRSAKLNALALFSVPLLPLTLIAQGKSIASYLTDKPAIAPESQNKIQPSFGRLRAPRTRTRCQRIRYSFQKTWTAFSAVRALAHYSAT